MNSVSASLVIVLIALLFLGSTECYVKVTEVNVPSHVKVGDSVWLLCEYQSQGDIYSLSWYLGQSEFYRWTPKANNPMQLFDMEDNFKVDRFESQNGHVYIHDVSLRAAGILRCEVSGEKPHFATDHKEAFLKVIDPPDTRPFINGMLDDYNLHDEVHLNCTSPRSKPPANLTFYINDEKILARQLLIEYTPKKESMTNLETAVLGLRFYFLPRYIHKDIVVVRCEAVIEDIYLESSQVILKYNAPKQYHHIRSSGVTLGNSGVPWRLTLLVGFFSLYESFM